MLGQYNVFGKHAIHFATERGSLLCGTERSRNPVADEVGRDPITNLDTGNRGTYCFNSARAIRNRNQGAGMCQGIVAASNCQIPVVQGNGPDANAYLTVTGIG